MQTGRLQTEDIDRAILGAVDHRARKVAMVIMRAAEKLGTGTDDDSLDKIAGRLYKLVDEGVVETAGNIENWRHSEVRLAPTR